MEVIGIQRTDSQKLQQQNGPRVSFNRDVHVKRIGKRPNETTNYPIQTTNLQPPETSHLRRELPNDLSEASILREAVHVLEQAERIKFIDNKNQNQNINKKHKNNNNNNNQILPNKFNSLPSRKKSKTTKPISRSVSDASAKKSKKPSIFNLFSRKSDSNLSEIEEDARFKESGGRRLQRSKSDIDPSIVNTSIKDKHKNIKKRNIENNNNNNNDDLLNNQTLKSTQLSPIIENSQSEDYFEKKFNINNNHRETLLPSGSTKLKESNQQSGNIGYTNHEDLDLIPSKSSISNNLKDTVANLAINQTKSFSDMHSSQLPAEKPRLTKGLTVDGMVKRLSLERFSPPPIISGPAFSYTRPNEQIIYAQLAPDSTDEHNNKMRSPSRDLESPSYRTNFIINNNKNIINNGRSSGSRNHENIPSHSKKSEIYINGDNNEFDALRNKSTRLQHKPTQIHHHQQSSPYHWQQLSPRNLSDDDEGLGFEPRKYFEEELASSPTNLADYQQFRARAYERSKSPSFEPPIIPVIRRSVSPIIDVVAANRGRADGMDSRRREREIFHEHFDDEFNTLSNRRTALESKIRSRKFGLEPEHHEIKTNNYRYSPERAPVQEFRNIEYDHHDTKPRYLSPEPENYQKFHKLNTSEIQHKYSPERNHLDMIASPITKKDMKSSKYTHTKYYDDGSGGVKEVYAKETRVDDQGKSHTHETRRRERLDSPARSKDPLLGMAERYRLDCAEPKSLDSQFSDMNGSSPEHIKRTELPSRMHHHHEENWQSSLKRDKRQQRSFDKGDSGIENDFRKESFNGDLKSKWRKRTFIDDIKSCELFIKRERHHTEELHLKRKKYDFVYRERSIDDGSHFDPRLDKYPKETTTNTTTTLRRKDTNEQLTSPSRGKESLMNGIDINNDGSTLKRDNKKSSSGGGGFERVKKLFSSGRKKENKDIKKKDPYMVKEEEMRSRYLEYSGPEASEHKVNDISTRRRLSTPKASPLLKRIPSEKTTIITSTTTSAETRPSPLALQNETVTKPEKSGWFKSLDRKSKKKQNEKITGSTSIRTSTDDDFSTLRSNKKSAYRPPPPIPIQHGKNLRFFGDTDIESNPPSVSRAATSSRTRPQLVSAATLNRNQKYSQSAYDLDRISKPITASTTTSTNRIRSSSLQNLDEGVDEVDHHKRTKHHSRSRNLHDISESGSETEERDMKNHHHHHHSSKSKLSTSRDKNMDKSHLRNSHEDHSYRRSNTRERSPHRESTDPTTRIEFRKPPPGPPKPARSAERGRLQSYSRERERLPDSSGTEGESSLHSQRSVVYLHATTVGAIPQPYSASTTSGRRRAISKEDVNNMKNGKEPMKRSVSRSVSMLAPWTPKHVHDGYEINYSQESQGQARPISTLPRKNYQGNGNTLSRSKKVDLTTKSSRKYASSKDDASSMRNSSITSASKSGISSNHRPYEKRSSSDVRRETNTIGRRRGK